MKSGEFYNEPVVNWARRNLQNRVEIKPLLSSKAGMIFTYSLLFLVPLAFIVTGVVAKLIGIKDQSSSNGAFVCGLVLLIPFGLIALLGKLTRANFPKSLDADGVNASMGRKFYWGKFHYVDHVSKYFRAGRVSQRVKDNQLELIFENGKVIIPPLIHDRGKVWDLINSMPAQVRDDGVPRGNQSATDAGNKTGGVEDLMKFIESLPRPENQDG
ncbi:MAG: hypothetical protein QOH51_1253 [Acidobacteriota bacterium]|jgi:hypothetical protein|nr:hypothetical protein [Acidobacteriota bacterium]